MSVPRRGRWTSDEDDILRQEAVAHEIASSVGRTVSAVRLRAYSVRVPLRQVITRPR
jgi:hypothetical protein